MERHELIALMGQLKLAGMRAAYDDVITAGLRAQHPVQRIIGELLLAQLAGQSRLLDRLPLGCCPLPGDEETGRVRLLGLAGQPGAGARAARGRLPDHPAQRRADRRHRHRQEPCIDSDRGQLRAQRRARAFDSSPRSTWSISSRPKRVPERPGASLTNSSASISSSSTSSVICHSRSAAGRCCSTRSAASTSGPRSSCRPPCACRMAERLRRRQNDHGAPRPSHPSLRNRRNRQRELALQEPDLTATADRPWGPQRLLTARRSVACEGTARRARVPSMGSGDDRYSTAGLGLDWTLIPGPASALIDTGRAIWSI